MKLTAGYAYAIGISMIAALFSIIINPQSFLMALSFRYCVLKFQELPSPTTKYWKYIVTEMEVNKKEDNQCVRDR